MSYGANVLKDEAAYYTLNNATIINGVLQIGAGGSATQVLQTSDLAAITNKLQFTCIPDRYADSYVPDIQVLVYAKMKDSGTPYTSALLFPVQVTPNKYSCEFQLISGEYEEMYVTISSKHLVSFTLWELCAEVSDEDITTIIDGVEQSLPRLLSDYNTFPLEVEQAETTVAVITCKLIQNTDLQGHFVMSFEASKAATLTLRFYDNEAEELFAPMYYDILPGYNSVDVPHAYLKRLAGLHAYVATAQVTAGKLSIDTRKILYTIDGGYLAERELDVAMDVTDIAIRQLASDKGPDEIWIIGLDAGEALVRKRRYNENNVSITFNPVGSLGKAIAAAIEFNGTWVLRFGENQYTLETEEDPWYFWVTEDHKLWGCLGLPSETNQALELATNVVGDVKACRGYSSVLYPEQDQGLIVAYIKDDGIPYYRSYSYAAAGQTVIWEEEQALDVPANVYTFINVHRLNDYRIGFELSGPTQNLWIISIRTYVGESAYPEIADLNAGYQINKRDWPTFVGYYSLDQVDPEVKALKAEYKAEKDKYDNMAYTVTVLYDHKLVCDESLYPLTERFTITGTVTNVIVESVKWENLEDNITKATLTINKALGLLYVVTLKGYDFLRYEHQGLICTLTSNVSIEVDNTNYINASASDKATLNPKLNLTADYLSVQQRNIQPKENAALGETLAITTDYLDVNRIDKELPEDAAMNENLSISVQYYKIEDVPI